MQKTSFSFKDENFKDSKIESDRKCPALLVSSGVCGSSV